MANWERLGKVMNEKKYKILIDNATIANNMDLTTATILIKALFNEYYNDPHMVITIQKEERVSPPFAD